MLCKDICIFSGAVKESQYQGCRSQKAMKPKEHEPCRSGGELFWLMQTALLKVSSIIDSVKDLLIAYLMLSIVPHLCWT